MSVFGFRAWIVGKLPQALFQRVAKRFEYLRAGLADFRFRFRANVRHDVARVFVELGALTWPNGFDLDPIALHDRMAGAGELNREAAER